MKICKKCDKSKTLEEFRVYKNAKGEIFYRSECKACHKKYQDEYRPKNRMGMKNFWLLRKFNITLIQYQDLFKKQNGLCAICDKPQEKKYLAVDHDHATGKIRGLLCDKCNRGIGLLCDDTSILAKAIKYLSE